MHHLSPLTQQFDSASDESVLATAISTPEVFSVLVKRYQGPFIAKAQSIVKSREDAEEIVIDAFAKIYQYADRFVPTPGATFKSWGYTILINTAFTRYQALKRNRNTVASVDPDWYEVMPDTDMRQFEKAEVAEMVVSVLARLPDQFRRVLSFYFLDGLGHREIAHIEGTTEGAIKTRMHRAKQEFQNIVREQFNK